MKYFRMTYEEVVFKRSYVNLLLLNAAIPGIKPPGDDDEEPDFTPPRAGSSAARKRNYTTTDNGNGFFASLM